MPYSKSRLIARSIVWLLLAGGLCFLAYGCLDYAFAKPSPAGGIFKPDAFKSESLVLGIAFLISACCSFFYAILSYKNSDASGKLKVVLGAVGFIGFFIFLGVVALAILFAFSMKGGIA